MVNVNLQSQSTLAILSDNRPTDYEYALLSEHVYQGAALKKNDIVSNIKNWKVEVVLSGLSDYVGAIYINNKTNQVVLVHRGTYSLGSLLEDFKGVYLQGISPQKKEVFKAIDQAIELAKDREYCLSFTGHSLGAFLAELSVYYCHRSKDYPNVNAVTFESPGSRESLDNLQSNLTQGKVDLDQLDIINYLSYPNLVNTCGHHVGSCYALMPDLGRYGSVNIWHLKQAHSMSNIVKLLGKADCSALYIKDWPIGSQRSYFFSNAEFNKDTGEYTLKEYKNEFELDYKAHYSLHEKFNNRNTLLLIHFSQPMQQWLKDFYKALRRYRMVNHFNEETLAQALTNYAIEQQMDATVLSYLLASSIVQQQNRVKVFYTVLDNKPVFEIRRELSEWLEEQVESASKLLSFLHLNFKQGAIEASLLEDGATFGEQGYIHTANVQGASMEFPEDTDEANIKHLQNLLRHFLEAVANTGVKIKATAFPKNSNFQGNIGTVTVTGVALRAVPRNQGNQAELINQQRVREGLARQSSNTPNSDNQAQQSSGEKKSTHIRPQM